MHGSPADTARSALTDSIKQVRVTFKSLYHDPKTGKDARAHGVDRRST